MALCCCAEGSSTPSAPAVKGGGDFQLPEGNQWRYSEFINAVQSGKVERVRFSKEGGQLQVRLSFRIHRPPMPAAMIQGSSFGSGHTRAVAVPLVVVG